MLRKVVRLFVILFVLGLISILSYNYYYYYKSLRINKDVYTELKAVVANFDKSLKALNDNDISGFLNSNYQLVRHSNYLKTKNHKIYTNIFVKINMLDGSFFSNEVSEALLWFNDLNTRLNNFYVLNNEFFNSDILVKNPEKAMANIKNIKSTILEFNTFLNLKNPRVLDMIEDQKMDNKYFEDLEKEIQLSYKFYETIDNFMGAKKLSKFLVLIQNSSNMNQSGGKWAYYTTLTCDKYKCKLDEIDFVSNLTSAMVDKLIPPEEIRTKKSIWVFEDLGWFFDFNESASLALKYYPTKTQFDGVIAFDINIFEKVFKNIDSIDFSVDEEKTIINENNVVEFLIDLTLFKNNKELALNSEKLSLFWNSFDRAFGKEYSNSNGIKNLMYMVYESLGNKNIQLYSSKNIIQSLKDLDYNNNLKTISKSEFFSLSKSNILDKVMDKNVNFKVNLKVDIDEENNIKNVAVVSVSNTNPSKIRDQVISYFQFYLNKGSSLISTNFPSKMGASKNSTVDYEKHGFVTDKKIDTINTKTAYLASDDVRVYEDGNFLIVGGWNVSSSGQNKKIEIDWKSNYKIEDGVYKLFVQKQPNVDYILSLEISYPSNINGKNTINKSVNIDEDKLIEIKID